MTAESLPTGKQQFEELLTSLLDSDEQGTLSLLTSAFIHVITGKADAESNTVGHDVVVLCDEYKVTIHRCTDVPTALH